MEQQEIAAHTLVSDQNLDVVLHHRQCKIPLLQVTTHSFPNSIGIVAGLKCYVSNLYRTGFIKLSFSLKTQPWVRGRYKGDNENSIKRKIFPRVITIPAQNPIKKSKLSSFQALTAYYNLNKVESYHLNKNNVCCGAESAKVWLGRKLPTGVKRVQNGRFRGRIRHPKFNVRCGWALMILLRRLVLLFERKGVG